MELIGFGRKIIYIYLLNISFYNGLSKSFSDIDMFFCFYINILFTVFSMNKYILFTI